MDLEFDEHDKKQYNKLLDFSTELRTYLKDHPEDAQARIRFSVINWAVFKIFRLANQQ